MVNLDHLVEDLQWQVNVFGPYFKVSGLVVSCRQIIFFHDGLEHGESGSKLRYFFFGKKKKKKLRKLELGRGEVGMLCSKALAFVVSQYDS